MENKKTFTKSADEFGKAWREFIRTLILEIRIFFIFNKDAASVIRDLKRDNKMMREALIDLVVFKHFPTSQNPKYARALQKGNDALGPKYEKLL